MGNLGDKRIIGIGISQHGADGQQNFRDGEGRRPLIPQNVKTDAAIGIDIGVVDTSGKVDLWRLERVVGRECDAQEEHAGRVWAV